MKKHENHWNMYFSKFWYFIYWSWGKLYGIWIKTEGIIVGKSKYGKYYTTKTPPYLSFKALLDM